MLCTININYLSDETFKKLMEKRDFLRIAKMTALLVPLLGCAGSRGRDFYTERINRISDIEVILNTETRFSDNIFEAKGNGFVLGHYVLSRDHVTSKYDYQMATPYGMRIFPLDRKTMEEETTSIDGIVLHPVIERVEDDLAIFDLSKTPELCKKYCNDLTFDDLMTSDELYKGMDVYWVGNPMNRPGFYRESIISNLKDEADKGTPAENTFMLQDPVVPGTSGKPIWSGNKIVGVAHYVWQNMAGIGFMDPYLERIQAYENDR